MSSEQKVRQRGKKKKSQKKQQEELEQQQQQQNPIQNYPQQDSNGFAGPSTSTTSWTRPATSREELEALGDDQQPWIPSAPFGLVDPDLKNYLREAFTQLKSLGNQSYKDQDQDDDDRFHFNHNDDYEEEEDESEMSQHSLLMKATLKELDGKELQVATDGEGSMLLEYLASRLDGKSLRILADRLAGNYSTIASHRFGSHVLQSLLSSLQKLISSETRIKSKSKQVDADRTINDENGVLRSATSLVLDMCSETSEDLSSLFQDQFGTHVIRSLLLLLSSRPISTSGNGSEDAASSLRSKRSSKFREGQDPNQESETSSNIKKVKSYLIPKEFENALEKLREDCLREVGMNEIRALAVNPVSSPTLQLILLLENEARSKADQEEQEQETSTQLKLSDLILGGLISSQEEELGERLDHLETLLRDPVGTHVLETLLKSVPKNIHSRFWRLYLKGRVIKLGTHPVANFVVASGIKRLGSDPSESNEEEDSDLLEAISEVKSAGDKLVKEGKIGILHALTNRCGHLGKCQEELIDAIRSAFRMSKDEGDAEGDGNEKKGKSIEEEQVEGVDLLVPVILSLRTKKAYIRTRGKKGVGKKGKHKKPQKKSNQENGDAVEDDQQVDDGSEEEMEATVQGSVLLQLMVRLSHPYNDSIYNSLISLPSLVPLCKSSIGSHVLLVSLSTTSATFQQRKRLIQALLPNLLEISKDKYGSRVCDSIWFNSDPFLKSKITRELLGKERDLAEDWYGRFFARKLNFGLFRKDEEGWKTWVRNQSQNKGKEEDLVKSLKEEGEEEFKKGKELEKVDVEDENEEQAIDGDGEEKNGKRKRDDKASERKKKKRAKKAKSKEDSELDKILGAL